MKRRGNPMAAMVLFIMCLALGYALYWELTGGSAPAAWNAGATATVEVPPLPQPTVIEMPPIGDFTETLRRPLFAASRRPPEEEPAQPAMAAKAPTLKLFGVVITPDDRSALIREPGSKEITELGVGEEVSGWMLEKVLPDHIIMRLGDSRETYNIDGETR